jgi:hypothetical protein
MALLQGANNMFGPIGPDIRARLVRYLERPSAAGWDDVHSIIINDAAKHPAPRTVWQAVIAVDRTFPKMSRSAALDQQMEPAEKWDRWPDAILLARAIKYALAQPQAQPEAR